MLRGAAVTGWAGGQYCRSGLREARRYDALALLGTRRLSRRRRPPRGALRMRSSPALLVSICPTARATGRAGRQAPRRAGQQSVHEQVERASEAPAVHVARRAGRPAGRRRPASRSSLPRYNTPSPCICPRSAAAAPRGSSPWVDADGAAATTARGKIGGRKRSRAWGRSPDRVLLGATLPRW